MDLKMERGGFWSSKWVKTGLVLGLLAVWYGLILVNSPPSSVRVYVRNVGCQPRGFRIGKWSYEAGPQLTVANDGVWTYLGRYDADLVEFQMYGENGRADYGMGLGEGSYNEWGGRSIVAVTMLEGGMIVTMKKGPPKPVSIAGTG